MLDNVRPSCTQVTVTVLCLSVYILLPNILHHILPLLVPISVVRFWVQQTHEDEIWPVNSILSWNILCLILGEKFIDVVRVPSSWRSSKSSKNKNYVHKREAYKGKYGLTFFLQDDQERIVYEIEEWCSWSRTVSITFI